MTTFRFSAGPHAIWLRCLYPDRTVEVVQGCRTLSQRYLMYCMFHPLAQSALSQRHPRLQETVFLSGIEVPWERLPSLILGEPSRYDCLGIVRVEHSLILAAYPEGSTGGAGICVLVAVRFPGERFPRYLVDERSALSGEGILGRDDLPLIESLVYQCGLLSSSI